MADDYDPRSFIGEADWTYAKTAPANPHEYVVRSRFPDDRAFLRFAEHIWEHGEDRRAFGSIYRYLIVDGWRYWTTGFAYGGPATTDDELKIVNRAREPESPPTLPGIPS